MLQAVRAGQKDRPAAGLGSRPERIARIRADIAVDLGVNCQQGSVAPERHRHIKSVVAPMRAGEQILAPVAYPFDRRFHVTRQMRRDHLLGVEIRFHAEAAADVRRDDAQARLVPAQRLGERRAHDVRHLRR